MGAPRPHRGSVRVFRLGRAKEVGAGERVRWAYALFLPEESLESLSRMLSQEPSMAAALAKLLSERSGEVIQGTEEVRRQSQQDAQLRRALRDARAALRQGSRDDSTK